MDGVDLAFVHFSRSHPNDWQHTVTCVKTFSYPEKLLEFLKKSVHFSVEQMCALDKELGRFFAEIVNEFILENEIKQEEIDAIASHGHTIFHQPENGFTLQIGCGTTIAVETGIQVINDFRSKDVILGGQGAPLVPIGDTLLYADRADAFLNIGGFANICLKRDSVIAFDIGPGNLPINELTQKCFGLPYDHNGDLAKQGKLISVLYEELNQLDYYAQSAPKSLGTEWLNQVFNRLLLGYSSEDPMDLLHTVSQHIAHQIVRVLTENRCVSVLITGGGAKNEFLIDLIRTGFGGKVLLPGEELIDFKEAIVFAFLGALYLDGKTNTLPSVTGAKRAAISGVLHTP